MNGYQASQQGLLLRTPKAEEKKVDQIRTLRDQLWQSGEISLAGLVRMDQALGVETYKDAADDGGGVSQASPSHR